jgi:hypothetical protein
MPGRSEGDFSAKDDMNSLVRDLMYGDHITSVLIPGSCSHSEKGSVCENILRTEPPMSWITTDIGIKVSLWVVQCPRVTRWMTTEEGRCYECIRTKANKTIMGKLRSNSRYPTRNKNGYIVPDGKLL